MTAQVIEAFGAHDRMTVDQAIGSARDTGMTECIVVGYGEGGGLVVRSSGMTRRDALWILEQAKRYTLGEG